jgi:hypothetical protein
MQMANFTAQMNAAEYVQANMPADCARDFFEQADPRGQKILQ